MNKEKFIMSVAECSDHKVIYGILEIGVTPKEVQERIKDIKNKFYDEGLSDWCIDDIFAEFPKEKEWEFKFHQYNYVEI